MVEAYRRRALVLVLLPLLLVLLAAGPSSAVVDVPAILSRASGLTDPYDLAEAAFALSEAGEVGAAVPLLRRAVKAAPGQMPAEAVGQLQYNLAYSLQQVAEYAEAGALLPTNRRAMPKSALPTRPSQTFDQNSVSTSRRRVVISNGLLWAMAVTVPPWPEPVPSAAMLANLNRTRGTSNASAINLAFIFQEQYKLDKSWFDLMSAGSTASMDTPAWWNLGHRPLKFIDGIFPGDSARVDLVFYIPLAGLFGDKTAQAWASRHAQDANDWVAGAFATLSEVCSSGACAAAKTMATELVKPTSTATKPATTALSEKSFHMRRA